tara:strand:- start:1377 stop:2450 length:1074 start_codon:yes stop_codon:yes gene_type:complete
MDEISNLSHNNYNVISTFSGCGGSSLGYKMAGYKVLWANEFIPAAQECYKVNHPTTFLNTKDIRDISPDEILKEINHQEIDIFDGSPPCASFSMAGKREKLWGREKKYSDTTQRVDDLFFEYVRLIKGIQPKVFVAENVAGLTMGVAKNILGSNQFDMFNDQKNTIIFKLEECGYKVDYIVLNAKYFGVPQSRKRLFIVGVRSDLKVSPTFPKRTTDSFVTVGAAFESCNLINKIDENYKTLSIEQSRVYDLQLPGESMMACGERLGQNINGIGRIKLDINKPSPTVMTSPELWHPKEKRSLSIGELKSICSFPCDFNLTGSFNRKWERLGRSVPPLMMKAIAETIQKEILNKLEDK